MRAHFAGVDDVAVAADNSVDKIEEEPLETRIDDFKKDTQNMAVLTEFIDDVLQTAETEAVNQQNVKNGKNSQQPKEKSRQSFTIPDFKNGKVVNRARGLVVRIFDAICNCANTAAAPAIKLRAKRASTNAGNKGTTADGTETKEKSKKQENGKEKKDDNKKKNEGGEQTLPTIEKMAETVQV